MDLIKQRYSRPQWCRWPAQFTVQVEGGPLDARLAQLVNGYGGSRHGVWFALCEALCPAPFGFIAEQFYYARLQVLQRYLLYRPRPRRRAVSWGSECYQSCGIEAG